MNPLEEGQRDVQRHNVGPDNFSVKHKVALLVVFLLFAVALFFSVGAREPILVSSVDHIKVYLDDTRYQNWPPGPCRKKKKRCALIEYSAGGQITHRNAKGV